MLSSQTKDEVTDAAVSKLRSAVGGSLTVDAIVEADETTISEAIAKVGFWRRKTQSVVSLHGSFNLSHLKESLDISCRRLSVFVTILIQMYLRQWTNYVHYQALAPRWRS